MESSDEALVQARRDKAARVRERGADPYSNRVEAARRAPVLELRRRCEGALLEPRHELRYDPPRVTELGRGESFLVLGRLMARRGFGKATFLTLRDATGEIQLFAKQDVMQEAFAALEEIDIADHVEASGPLMVTRTGELSIELQSLRLLTKALRPLPDKWHGLTDTDLRYRRRYVDLVANPEVSAVLRARAAIISALRAFLDARGFLEVETPTLHSLIGGAAARPFETHHNTYDLDLFLRIAPELYLKRLLVGGLERVYEIGRCYRNEGVSTRHNPEFTMLELYQAYATHDTLMDLSEAMLREVDQAMLSALERQGLGASARAFVEGRGFSLEVPFARVPLSEAVAAALQRAALASELVERLPQLGGAGGPADAWVEEFKQASPRAASIDWPNLRRALAKCENDGERRFVAYEYWAEPFLSQDYRTDDGQKSRPVLITDYPFEVSPLARRKDSDPSLTDRFELFVDGRELCNAFSELNDPDDQKGRFEAQVEAKARGAAETMDFDADYIRALEHGMPPAAGFGLGVDRLTMALTAQPSIRDVIAFPLLRPEA